MHGKLEMAIWIALSSRPISVIFYHRLGKSVTEILLMLWILCTKQNKDSMQGVTGSIISARRVLNC
jgi:hypothetical protein